MEMHYKDIPKQTAKQNSQNKKFRNDASPALRHKSKAINTCFVFWVQYPRLCVSLILVRQSGLKRKKGGGGTLRRAS